MVEKVFRFEEEFKLGIEAVDCEHIRLVEMLNDVYARLGEGDRRDAAALLDSTLANYVIEHFTNEEAFLESIGYPQLEDHRRIHEAFRKTFQQQQALLAGADDTAFRTVLADTYAWIITHIGKTDRKYAGFL